MALAIFDLDNTLIAGDSDHGWGEFLVAKNKVDRNHYQKMNDRFYVDYEAGCLDILAYLEFSLAPLAATPMAELAQLHLEFMQQVIAPLRLPKADALIEKHRLAGDRLLVITSTNRFIVEPICHALGIDELLATDPEIVDGRYSGKIVGVPTYQAGKVERLNLWLSEHNETRYCWKLISPWRLIQMRHSLLRQPREAGILFLCVNKKAPADGQGFTFLDVS
jgi:HAD superfamily hydrolase (TIGR01490 family)